MNLTNRWLDRTGTTIAGRPVKGESFYNVNSVKVVDNELIVNGVVVAKLNESNGTTNVIPVKSLEFDEAQNTLNVKSEVDGVEKTQTVSLSVLQDVYTPGDGIEVGSDKSISIKKDANSETYLKVTEDGISIVGIDELKDKLKEDIEKQKNDLLSELNKITSTYNKEWFDKVENFINNHPHDMGTSPFPTDTYGPTHPSA